MILFKLFLVLSQAFAFPDWEDGMGKQEVKSILNRIFHGWVSCLFPEHIFLLRITQIFYIMFHFPARLQVLQDLAEQTD